MKTLFVTASGTGTGKTYVTGALAAAFRDKGLSVRVLKPVVSGYPGDDAEVTDTAILLKSLEIEPTQEAVEACSPWRFTEPLPEPVDSFIAAHRDRPLLKWACAIYDDYRNTEK